MTLFLVARPVALKVLRAWAPPTPFRPNWCNRVITHENATGGRHAVVSRANRNSTSQLPTNQKLDPVCRQIRGLTRFARNV